MVVVSETLEAEVMEVVSDTPVVPCVLLLGLFDGSSQQEIFPK